MDTCCLRPVPCRAATPRPISSNSIRPLRRNSLTDVTPTNPNLSGTVALRHADVGAAQRAGAVHVQSSQLYVYTPSGSPQAAWKPTITSVVANGNHYTLTGTQLNGLSAGASYGDDAEMDTNYPIIEADKWHRAGLLRADVQLEQHRRGHGQYAGDHRFFAAGLDAVWHLFAHGGRQRHRLRSGVSFTGGIVGSSADLVVTNSGPNSSTEGNNVTFNLTVTNNGPTNATNVVLTDTLDTNLKYVSATKSQGTFTQSGSVVTFSLGSLAVGQTATATVTAQALEAGNLTDTASATSSLRRCQSVQQHRGRVGPSGRSGDRGLRAADHHQPDAHQSDRGDLHARQRRGAGQRLCGHDQLGRCHDLHRHHYASRAAPIP